MNDIVAELIGELKALRKGRGIDDRELRRRTGPALSSLLDLGADATVTDVRAALRAWLATTTAQLPDDLRLAVLVAFGVHPDAPNRFYRERVAWLAGQLHRDERTAQRRIDEASGRLADLAVAAAGQPPGGECPVTASASAWHSESITSYVVLDGAGPEVIESRRIVGHGDGLAVVDLAVTMPAPGADSVDAAGLRVDMVSGGTVVRTGMESSRRVGIGVELPAPLGKQRRAEFTVRFRVVAGLFEPYYVCVPRQRCDRFELRVRFGRGEPPAKVYRLVGALQADVDDPGQVGESIVVDGAGELAVTFDDLKPGFAYGARWSR